MVTKKSKKSPKKSPKKKISGKSRGCVRQTTAKYTSRPSPPYPANECCNQTKRGNDGNLYMSRKNSAGICTWKRA